MVRPNQERAEKAPQRALTTVHPKKGHRRPWMKWVYVGISLATGDLSCEMCPLWSSTPGVVIINTKTLHTSKRIKRRENLRIFRKYVYNFYVIISNLRVMLFCCQKTFCP